MFNPLVDNLKPLKDLEIETKILELSKKYSIAARLGNGNVCQQILILLEQYKEEQRKRQKDSLESIAKRQDKDIDTLINVE